jgi:tetratricopeptide (TPR) repeat protein
LEIECSDVANPPYAKLSGKTGEIDFVQFPHQTLTTAEGDAVELAVLFASLLEASGIETAFVHVPGKIFPAFSPMLTDTGTQYTFFNPDTLFIEKGGRIWIPVDITASNLDFRGAVISARKQWEEDQENVLLYSLTECREAYHPLGAQTGTGEAVVLPTTIAELYKEAEAEHIDWMIEERIVALQEEISRSGNDERTINALGVLYARYEKYDEAIGEFTRTTVEHEYMPSLVNLGNIYYLEDDLRMAKPFYERAYEVAPFDPRVLLAVAKVNHKLENYGNARDAYDKLVNIEPELAQQFSYLNLTGEEAVEAAKKVKEKDVVVWIDE